MLNLGYRLGGTILRGGAGTRPSLNLNFLSGTLDSRVTFSRTSNATLVDSTGRVTYAPNNLVLRSEEFDDAAWTKTGVTVTANATTAPNGTITADKLVENTDVGAAHFVTMTSSPSLATGQFGIYSVYVKAAERTFFQLILTGIGAACVFLSSGFDLTNGTAGVVTATATSTITPVGDGWYRCSIMAPAVTASVVGGQIRLAAAATGLSAATYTGNGTSGLFVWGAQFEQVTYQTQPSTYNKTAASAYYGPRFDYNPITLAPRGLLIEEQQTNLIIRSEEFDNSTWAKDFITATANSATAPNGTTTADKLIPDAAADLTSIGQGTTRIGATYSASTTHTFSVFAKEAEFDRIQLFFSEGTGTGNRAQVEYSLVDGSVVTAAAVVGTFTSPSSTSTSFGNGWYRFTLTFTTGTGVSGRARLAVRDSGTTTGDGTSGILLWGAQVEEGAFATSYIPTAASTVTRAADLASMTGTNFSSWYNQSEGTIVWDATSFSTSSANAVVNINSNSTANRIYGYFSATAAIGLVTTTSSEQVSFNSGTLSGGLSGKTAFAYALNNFAQSTRGAAVITDSSGTVPTVSQMNIGTSHASVQSLNGHIRTITYYPQRIHNPELQILSVSDPSLNLNFLSGTLDNRITFTRSTTGTFVGSNGLIQSTAINAPRFDYDPVTLAPRGLLIEEQRVNLLLRSEEFDNASWSKVRSSITANATTSPDGTMNADRFVIDTTAASNHSCGQSVSVTSGTTYAFTVFAKADQFSQINLRFSAQFPAGNAVYDLNSGTVDTNGTVVSASMTSFGNGWWRCVLVMTASATGTSGPQIFLAQSSSITIATADNTSGLFIWGAQLEASTFPASYIPTVASTVTRAADSASITGANFSSWYNASEATIVVSGDSSRGGVAGTTRNFLFVDSTANNIIRSNGTSTLQVVDGGVTQATIAATPSIPFDGTVYKFASTYRLNDFATVTTAPVVTDTSGTVPTGINQLVLGGGSSTTILNGHIRTFTYYPQRIDNAQLPSLTV